MYILTSILVICVDCKCRLQCINYFFVHLQNFTFKYIFKIFMKLAWIWRHAALRFNVLFKKSMECAGFFLILFYFCLFQITLCVKLSKQPMSFFKWIYSIKTSQRNDIFTRYLICLPNLFSQVKEIFWFKCKLL
jgi:hypothetical protein